MLSIRKRGKIYYVRGTVKVGNKSRQVLEHSSGCYNEQKAKEYASSLEERIRNEVLYGKQINNKQITFGDIAKDYITNKGNISNNELGRIKQLLALENITIDELQEAWKNIILPERRAQNNKPSTIDRLRTTFLAILNYGKNEYHYSVPEIKKPKYNNERVRFLNTIEERERLLLAYPFHVRLIAIMLCFNGCRTQEALQLLWSDVDLDRKTIRYRKTKNGEDRTVPMHNRTYKALLLAKKRQTDHNCYNPEGHVFLNIRFKPYKDTRKLGGNPLSKTHNTACKIAGIVDFTVHDWRHHWASWCIMNGMGEETLRRLGGWKKSDMIKRYVALKVDYMADELNKIK